MSAAVATLTDERWHTWDATIAGTGVRDTKRTFVQFLSNLQAYCVEAMLRT